MKPQASLPDFKAQHDCKSKINNCSFFIKEKLKQIKADSKIRIVIKQVSNPYLVKADGFVYPNNNLLQIDDSLLHRMTFNQIQSECDKFLSNTIKMGFPYGFKMKSNWNLKQKYFINAVVAGASRLVNEADVSSAMKKTLLYADSIGLESLVFIPCDNGTHDISLISMAQISAIFSLCQKHEFQSIKSVYICMEDEESEQSFIEYYNRIFKDKNESRNEINPAIDSQLDK